MFEQGMIIQNRYEIIEEVGSGGMSIVYKAKDHVLNRFVAMKVLKPEFSDDKSFVNKFRIEAQSAAGLSHPNIVNVFDVGEENGFYYIVMELVEGITLKEYIQQNGRLSYQTALDFITQITAGIEVAHEHHTIHRDIKPQNIIVSRTGTLKVTDFGIAKAATSNTVASSAMGSVHYISPEQARGGYSDERSDIYSLGITLYEMLTGRVPYEGENNVTVALMHIQGEMIPPREYYPDIPVGLEKIVLKATQKKPERRYLTANALLSDLKKLAMDPTADVGVTVPATPVGNSTIRITDEEIAQIREGAAVSSGTAAGRNQGYNSSSGFNGNRDSMLSVFPVEKGPADSVIEVEHPDPRDTAASSSRKSFEEEDEYEREDDAEDLDPKMEKMITIGAIIATVIVAIAIIVAIATLSRSFKREPASVTTQEVTTESVSTTEESINMIGVVGLSEEDARAALEDARIPFETEYSYSEVFAKDTVMSQSVIEGSPVREGERVKLVISKGQEEDQVPDVVGKTLQDAKSTLENAGFKVEEDDEYDETVEKDHIIKQSPEGDSSASKGSTVRIVVSKGKEVKVAVVPDLKKKTVTEAEKALSDVKLKLGNVTQEYSDNIKEGQVISQSIASGTEVKEETAVDITISKGKKPTTTTYTVSFSGSIANNGFEFQEGQLVHITLTLQVGGASYEILNEFYDEVELPISVEDAAEITDLLSKDGTLIYSVTDEEGNDVTGSFSSTVQARFKTVEK